MTTATTATSGKCKKKTKSSTKKSVNPLSDARRVQMHNDGDSDESEQILNQSHSKGRKRTRNEDTPSTSTSTSTRSIDTSSSEAGESSLNREKGPVLTKADLKARELWHKKSGAGYYLFVQYYASQPVGVVSDIDVVVDGGGGGDGKNNNGDLQKDWINFNYRSDHLKSNKCVQGKGQSRAAKKRRKKKMKEMPSSSSTAGTRRTTNTTTTTSTTIPMSKGMSTHIDKSKERENPMKNDSFIPRKSHANMTLELQHAIQQQTIDCQHIKPYLSSLSQELPLTFRIRQHHRTAEEQKDLENFVQTISTKYNHLIQPVSYDPSQKIYQAIQGSGLVKSTLGKISPELKSLIVDSSTNGLIARQELGSMLPVLALNASNSLKYGAKVLDMCSSPGSKTLQALEIVASKSMRDGDGDSSSSSNKPGRLVANDIHPLRIQSLKEAISRSGLPSRLTSRIIYTNHDASTFPSPKSGKLFDCIIADVPCSGDGTIRKDFRVLSGWMPSIGHSLHSVQKKILMRAMRLVKVGGVVAYSTCSLNPVEDEAVVASALSWANNNDDQVDNDYKRRMSFELLEWPKHLLPSFIRSQGVKNWAVGDFSEVGETTNQKNQPVVAPGEDLSKLRWFDCFDDAKEAKMVHAVRSMWPSLEVNSSLDLARCVRLRPQSHDSGGFFVALLKRIK